MTKGGKLNEGIFVGETINTPSMLCVEDYLDALQWAKSVGGLKALQARADANAKVIADWVTRTSWIDFLTRDPALRSNTSVCLKVVDAAVSRLAADAQAEFVKGLAAALEKEGVAYDINAYRDAPPGLRIWCGSTWNGPTSKRSRSGSTGPMPKPKPRSPRQHEASPLRYDLRGQTHGAESPYFRCAFAGCGCDFQESRPRGRVPT
jgi:hypothetical protein